MCCCLQRTRVCGSCGLRSCELPKKTLHSVPRRQFSLAFRAHNMTHLNPRVSSCGATSDSDSDSVGSDAEEAAGAGAGFRPVFNYHVRLLRDGELVEVMGPFETELACWEYVRGQGEEWERGEGILYQGEVIRRLPCAGPVDLLSHVEFSEVSKRT